MLPKSLPIFPSAGNLTTERCYYDRRMTAATPFATDASCTVSKRSVEIIARDSLRFGQIVMIDWRRLGQRRENVPSPEHRKVKSAPISSEADLEKLPDLGFRNCRFQDVPFRFNNRSIYQGKDAIFNDQNRVHER
jgi:hypothetical protein